MKYGKKILSVLLALLMMMSLATNAMAADGIRSAVSITKQIVTEEPLVPETRFTFELTDPDGHDIADCGISMTRNTISVYESVSTNVEFLVDPDKISPENGWVSRDGIDTHFFYLSERNDGKLGWTYDETEYIVEVVHEGGTINTRVYQGSVTAETAVDAAVFTNRYVNHAAVEIPFTKTVTQGASVAPGAQAFDLEVKDVFFLQEESYADVTYTAEVHTNGAGNYDGRIVISGPAGQVQSYIDAGFIIGEKDTGAANWTYSDTLYYVKSNSAAAGTFQAYPARMVVTEGVIYYEVLQQEPVDRMVFENVYAYDDLTPVEIRIPFTKTVVQGASAEPGAQTFELEIADIFNSNAEGYEDVTYTAEVHTNGTGDYEGELLITGPAHYVQEYVCEGFVVREKNTGAANWTYSDAVYCVVPAFDGGFKVYPAEAVVTENGTYYEPDEEQPADRMVFENVYTYDDLTPVTIEIPFTKTVKQGGSKAPGAQAFELEIADLFNSNAEGYEDVTYTAEVQTNGAGNYEGKLLITGPERHVQEYICEGLVVREKNTGAANWTYSDALYCVIPAFDGGFEVYPAEKVVTENGTYYEPAEEQPVERMVFENIYTATGSSNAVSPKTGDSSSFVLWSAMCLTSGAAAVLLIVSRKKRARNEE